MSSKDTAGIINGDSEADWKETLRIANERYRRRQADLAQKQEDREASKTIPEWQLYDTQSSVHEPSNHDDREM